VDFASPVAGDEVSQPFTGNILFNNVTVSAPGLPNAATQNLPPGVPVMYSVNITNNGVAPQNFFVDARLNGSTSLTLASLTSNTVSLPLTGNSPTWFVPNETSSVSLAQTSSLPAMFDYEPWAGDPDLASANFGTGPLCSTAALGSYIPTGGAVTTGLWYAGPTECGPYPAGAPPGTATITMTATTKPFDSAVSSSTGDYWMIGATNSGSVSPLLLNPGQSGTINVTITPSGSNGTVVSGALYIGAIAGSVPPFGDQSADELAAIPYEYTVATAAPPAVTSASATTFTTGTAGSFTVTTTGSPTPAISKSGTLPMVVTFTDNGNGTATLAGTPAAGTGGPYPITITASNGQSPNATQNFTLTVDQPPAITSAAATTFTSGTAATFTVTTTGYPKPALSKAGTLPSGVTFTDNDNGTATLQIGATAVTGGIYTITITASNSVLPNATQTFKLTVNQAPHVTSLNYATFTKGVAGTYTITTSGYPVPSLSFSPAGSLPAGVMFVDNHNGTATISGKPTVSGTFSFWITATNGVSPQSLQSFSLTVKP
jgi:hypothetical protein